jgi:hypothetical protein
VEAKECTFVNADDGVYVCGGKVQLDKCMAVGNEGFGVVAVSGADVRLTGCTLADSLDKSGLCVQDKGTRATGKECIFLGNNGSGVAVVRLANLQLDACVLVGNKGDHVLAFKGGVAGLVRCIIADCVNGHGVTAMDEGACVGSFDCFFSGNKVGVNVFYQGTVQLNRREVASNKQLHVQAKDGAVVRLMSCTVAGSPEGVALWHMANGAGTRVQANKSTF